MGPIRGFTTTGDKDNLRALSPLSRPKMAARVIAQTNRAGIGSLNSYDSPTQRRYRTKSQNRPLQSTASPRAAPNRTPRSVSAQRPVGGSTPGPSTPITLSALSQRRRTPLVTGTKTTPVRPTRGPILTPNRKASAPSKLISSSSQVSTPSSTKQFTTPARRRPTPHSNTYLSNLAASGTTLKSVVADQTSVRRNAPVKKSSENLVEFPKERVSNSSSDSSGFCSLSSFSTSSNTSDSSTQSSNHITVRKTSANKVPSSNKCVDVRKTSASVENLTVTSSRKRKITVPVISNENNNLIESEYRVDRRANPFSRLVTSPTRVLVTNLSPLSPISPLEKTEYFEAGFLDVLPGLEDTNRISKDHGGSKTTSDSRKVSVSSSHFTSFAPGKRTHKEAKSASSEILDVPQEESSLVPLKSNKVKKLAKGDDVDSVNKVSEMSGNPSEISSTITINSIVPEMSATAIKPFVVNSVSSKDSKTSTAKPTDEVEGVGSSKQSYNVTTATSKLLDQPLKSVTITKVEGTDKISISQTSSNAPKVISAQRKLSPTSSGEITARKPTSPRTAPKVEMETQSSGAPTRKFSGSSVIAPTSKKFKNAGQDFLTDSQCEEMADEESNVGHMKDKIKGLEKMVSDLVKNSEIKKQEIAALKMEIKRLKEAARERGHTSDEDNSKRGVGGASATSTPISHPPGVENKHTAPSDNRVDDLVEENRSLRNQLLHLGGSLNSSRLSDQEKEALMKGGSWGERSTTGATVGDWDNKSSSSEVSVACLQDRIMQMEETHYCTNEELQATLQELDDLREQLAESMAEIHTMQEEKQVLLESLTQQTERLTDTRKQNQTLKQLVIQHSENSHSVSNCVSTQRLMELLKSVEDDRERLVMMQEDLQSQKNAAAMAEKRSMQDSQMYRDRMKSLESLVECSSAGKAAAEATANELQNTVKGLELEKTRLETALTNAKEKIGELEGRLVGGGSVGEVLEVVRAEKLRLEEQVEELLKKQDVAAREAERMKETVGVLEERLKEVKDNARHGINDASALNERIKEEKRRLQQQIATAESALADAKLTSQRHLQNKRELKTALSDLQKKLDNTLEEKQNAEQLRTQQKEEFDKQVSEWEQFQCDLLTTVRVANDFKTEAMSSLEKITQENSLLKHKVTMLERKVNGAKSVNNSPSASLLSGGNSTRKLSRADSRVKSLIESLESTSTAGTTVSTTTSSVTTPTTLTGRPGGRSASTSTIETPASIPHPVRKTSQPTGGLTSKRPDPEGVLISPISTTSPLKESQSKSSTGGAMTPLSPLRSIQNSSSTPSGVSSPPSTTPKLSPAPPSSPTANLPDTVKMSQLTEGKSKPISILSHKVEIRRPNYPQLSVDKKDPLARLAHGGGSKRNALLKWCQNQTLGYSQVDITNFSSSWNDGLALCAILDTYIPEKINYRALNYGDKRANFETALKAAESVGITSTLDVDDMMTSERPNWQTVYNYVTCIYSHFET